MVTSSTLFVADTLSLLLFPSTVSSDSTAGGVTNSSEFTADVLRVVNKIMEGSIRCQEELTMMGESVSRCISFHLVTYPSRCDSDPLNALARGSVRLSSCHYIPPCLVTGILPGVMRLLQEASRAIAGVKSREKLIATQRDKLPSYTALAFSSFLPHSMLAAQSIVDHSKVHDPSVTHNMTRGCCAKYALLD